MASSSSLHLSSQALLSLHAFNSGCVSPSLSFPSFFGLKSHSSCKATTTSTTSSSSHRKVACVKAIAVETLDQTTEVSLIEKSINTIHFLSVDAIEKANFGHPGLPMQCAPMGHILYDEFIRYNPKNPYVTISFSLLAMVVCSNMLSFTLLAMTVFSINK